MISEKDRAKIESSAKRLLKRGRLEDAVAEYRKLLVGDDRDVLTRNIIGDLYVKVKQYGKASEEFHAAADIYERKGLESKAIALYKKITKISPDDIISIGKLADFFRDKGFLPEAKKEYKRLAECLKKQGKTKRAIAAYERLLALERNNPALQRDLAELYEKDGQKDAAIRLLNETAEERIRSGAPDEAKPLLKKARTIDGENVRTLSNVVSLMILEDRLDQAVHLIKDLMERNEETPELLSILGRVYFESEKWEEADAVLARILDQDPKNPDARLKSGKIRLMKKDYDAAFEKLEPLIDSMTIRQKTDKAVGLLGLIILENKAHLTSLKKLFAILSERKDSPELETVARLLLREYDRLGEEKEAVPVLRTLLALFPDDKQTASRYEVLRSRYPDMAPTAASAAQAEPGMSTEAMEVLQASLEKVELYVEEGRYREAKKFFDQLRMNYPDNPDIARKGRELEKAFAQAEKDIPLEKSVEREGISSLSGGQAADEMADGPKKTAADIFAGTDIIPLGDDASHRTYYDLSQVIMDEMAALQLIYDNQKKAAQTAQEKELGEIVARFRRGVENKLGKKNPEIHYNLGIAYLDQGLVEEALDEFKLAAVDEDLRIAAYSNISLCLSKKKDYEGALGWVGKALDLSEEGSPQAFALLYSKALILIDLNRGEESLALLRKVHSWDPDFRDVSRFVGSGKGPGSPSKKSE
jgi:tetratricopeptide (TPR) repeat protein